MKTRTVIALILACCAATASLAETVRVNSGEHSGFSRLVVEIGTSVAWEVGRVEQGYELRVDVEDTDFDTSRVFNFIPRNRIAALSQPGPGRLVISTDCACFADAFEVSRGRIVLDIRDGEAPELSTFELPLGTVRHAQASPSVEADQDAAPALPAIQTNADLAPRFLRPPSAAPELPDDVDTANLATPAPISSPAAEPFDIPVIEPLDLPQMPVASGQADPSLQSDPPDLVVIAPDTELPIVDAPAPETRSLFGDQYRSLSVPDVLTAPPGASDRDRVEEVQTALVQQLQKAVAQGLISIPQAEIDIPQLPTETADAEPVDPPDPPPETASNLDHVFVETAADRDALSPVVRALRQNHIESCLPPELFDVANWGPDEKQGLWFDDIRSALVGEFDKPREDVILRMARRYIYFGFGVEARSLLDGFDIQGRDAAVIRELASLTDEDVAARPITRSQARCASPAALWSMLSQDKPVDILQVDKNAVLRNFSALPLHLRNHLGPELARRFIQVDDDNAARSVRGFMDRGGVADEVALNMIDAQLALAEQEVEAASPILETVVAEDGPDAAIALAELIENRSNAGLEVSADLARSADALAVEYRGTELGSRIVKASIRAYSVSGQPEVTFRRIDEAVAAGSISEEEARILRSEAHLQSAARSNDVVFLRLVYQYAFPANNGPETEAEARRAVARRLAETGFPDRARQTLDPLQGDLTTEDRTILARIALAGGDPDRAIDIVGADPELAESELAANAWEQLGDLARAAEIRAGMGMIDASQRLAARSGNWGELLGADDPVLQDAARLAISAGEQPSTPIPLDRDTPLADAKTLVERSAEARRVLSELMTN